MHLPDKLTEQWVDGFIKSCEDYNVDPKDLITSARGTLPTRGTPPKRGTPPTRGTPPKRGTPPTRGIPPIPTLAQMRKASAAAGVLRNAYRAGGMAGIPILGAPARAAVGQLVGPTGLPLTGGSRSAILTKLKPLLSKLKTTVSERKRPLAIAGILGGGAVGGASLANARDNAFLGRLANTIKGLPLEDTTAGLGALVGGVGAGSTALMDDEDPNVSRKRKALERGLLGGLIGGVTGYGAGSSLRGALASNVTDMMT